MDKKLIVSEQEASLYDESVLGGKALNMAWLSRNKLPVPEWFVITTDAFMLQLNEENLYHVIQDNLKDIDAESTDIDSVSENIRDRIIEAELHYETAAELDTHLNKIQNWENVFFAIRSSAVGEDAASASFAGQMDSFLFQKGSAAIKKSIVKCFASAFTSRALKYRLHHDISIVDIQAAVIVQRMIPSRVSGVFFTAHPVSGSRKHGLISACYGTGEGIVSGQCNTDDFSVENYGSIVDRNIADKDCQVVFDSQSGVGTVEEEIKPDLRKQSCLTDEEVMAIVGFGRTISEKLSFPQDIEWTFDNSKLYILQTRPVTSLPEPAVPIGKKIVWDNSNIQESYCGVTTPLTFSFASNAYATVYEQTIRLLGVPKKKIEELRPAFRNLLGLIHGRIYYNINNWYHVLAILPSFKTNKADMERMMGLQDPVDFIEDEELSFLQKLKKLPGILRAYYKLMSSFRKIDSLISEFRELFDKEYTAIDRSLFHTLEMAELIGLTHQLDTRVTHNWETPIINDFYVMMMNGRVHRWLERAEVENQVIVQNNLMSGEEGIESTEPTKSILRICEYIRGKPELVNIIKKTENKILLNAIQVTDEELYDKCMEYIELYGDRCIGELKLESITLRHDSSFLFAIIKNYLSREDLNIETLSGNEQKFRKEAEVEAFGKVKKNLGKYKLHKFKKDLLKLRQAVKNRENMRLMRTRMFGIFRDICLEIGAQLSFYDFLEDSRDIFYITVDELEEYMEGRSIQSKFKSLVASRKIEFQSYEELELPHHFETMGPVYHHNKYEYDSGEEVSTSDSVLHGTGCYPGIVEEKIKLILSPKDELNLNGQILCTVRTDPGWAPLFPTAGGILVERGSTLSHSAVVARELGIPAIVNIPGITKIVSDGERVRMDGTKGSVERNISE